MSRALAVFAKRPIPGRVKTRLTSHWTAEQAAGLYWSMVQDTWAKVSAIANIEAVLFVDDYCEEFTKLAAGNRIELQADGDLGSRMYHCLKALTSDNLRSSIIIGTDSPSVTEEYLQRAFSLLETRNDAVLGPTEDGGYYLVGCRQAHPDMFKGVTWSSASTFEGTRDAFAKCGLRARLAPIWWDVDTPADLIRLAQSPNLGPNVRGWLDRAGEFPAERRDG